MSAPFGLPIASPEAERLVDDGERIDYAGFHFEVREIPGHSPGSVVFVCNDFDPPFVFGGDVLFAGSIGRTDLGGNMPQLLDGIRAKLFPLPDKTVDLPGPRARHDDRRGETVESVCRRVGELLPSRLNERLGDFRSAPVVCKAHPPRAFRRAMARPCRPDRTKLA